VQSVPALVRSRFLANDRQLAVAEFPREDSSDHFVIAGQSAIAPPDDRPRRTKSDSNAAATARDTEWCSCTHVRQPMRRRREQIRAGHQRQARPAGPQEVHERLSAIVRT
jgi:hypothetical protein